MRIACGVEYDGSEFSGWQRQRHARSVQAEVEAALARVADHPLEVACAGRTDAGVHATWQVIHFDSAAGRSERSWVLGANANLPRDVRLLWAKPVEEDFHARFSARARSYRYVILNSEVPSALLRQRVTWTHRPLDEGRMREGARHLLGEHDFSSFRATACQAHSPVREVSRLDLQRSGACLYLDIEANAFLHHMVRNIAGVLMAVGCGDRDPGWVRELLEQRDRARGGVTAPARGLYLTGVRYPRRYAIAETGMLPRYL
ncbi:MAG TPA: tRNA pseudouridine(38-40) synthase TruA [Gammaproteobacteria bacterium]|nr:tRNA pseudouridine(38-40) synthase TruA [Gammaproteobacteria bacterium]